MCDVAPPLVQHEPVIDEAVFSTLLGLASPSKPQFVNELLELFLGRADEGLAVIGAALASEDLDTVYRASHSLKASSGMLGALRLQGLFVELNRAAEAGLVAAAERSYGAAVAEHVRVREVMERWLREH